MDHASPSQIDIMWVPTMHCMFPVRFARVKGPGDARPLLVLSELRDVLLCSLVNEKAVIRKQEEMDDSAYVIRRSITHEERRVLVAMEVLPEKSTTNVTLCKCVKVYP